MSMLVDGALNLVYYGETACARFGNFLYQYFFLHFKSSRAERQWHKSALKGKMVFVRTCCVVKIIVSVALLAGNLIGDSNPRITDTQQCISNWAFGTLGVRLVANVVAIICTFIPWTRLNWQWLSGVFILLSMVVRA